MMQRVIFVNIFFYFFFNKSNSCIEKMAERLKKQGILIIFEIIKYKNLISSIGKC